MSTDNRGKPVTSETDDVLIPAGGVAIAEKLSDAMTPGYAAEFDPDEAEMAGAFAEDALNEQDALDSSVDSTDKE